MSLATRIILSLLLTVVPAVLSSAQEATGTAATSTAERTVTATAADGDGDAREGVQKEAAEGTAGERAQNEREGMRGGRRPSDDIRNMFGSLLRQNPTEVTTILRLDPTLLSDPAYMARYPEIAEFVARYPEVRHNPRYYLGQFEPPENNPTSLNQIVEPLMIMFTFAMIGFVLSWVVRTIIEQKRWNRLSRTQAEVHNKILDRFGTTAELLEYIRTPSGSKFLESAPIPLHVAGAGNPPQTRTLWSVQIGVIVGAASLGMLMVSFSLDKDDARALFAMGVIAFCIGVGFVASAFVSLFLSRKLGLTEPAPQPTGEPGVVR